MKKFSVFICMLCASIFTNGQPCSNLFFSEYVEGTGNNKALEIYNPTTTPVDLSIYKVQLYYNGDSAPSVTLNLAGVINPDDVYVIVNSQANASIRAARDTTSGVTNFNGNDAVALVYGNTNIDIIGEIGVDPGAGGWTLSNPGSTADYTLVRRPQVHEGTTDWQLSRTEWVVLPVDCFLLGFHTKSACPVPVDTAIRFSPTSFTVMENAGTHQLNLALNQSAFSPKSVDVELISGNPADIGNFMTQTVNIPSGTLVASIPIAITDDTIPQGDRQFVFRLTDSSSGLKIDDDSLFTLTIADDDTLLYTSIKNIAPRPAIIIYPNPNNGIFNIQTGNIPAGTLTVKVMDVTGRLILEKVYPAESLPQLDLRHAEKGIYFVEVFTENTASRGKLMIE